MARIGTETHSTALTCRRTHLSKSTTSSKYCKLLVSREGDASDPTDARRSRCRESQGICMLSMHCTAACAIWPGVWETHVLRLSASIASGSEDEMFWEQF